MSSSIVLSPNFSNYRRVAQKQLGLTDDQMRGMDVHHNPPVSEGGRNIPEHLFVYHPTLHTAIHGGYTEFARKGGEAGWKRREELGMGKGYRTGGGPPKKTQASPRDIEVAKLRHMGLSRKEIAEKLNITETMVKRSVREARKFGLVFETKPGPKKGVAGKSHTEETKQKIREKRANQIITEESNRKRSESMKKYCETNTWSRRKKVEEVDNPPEV